MNINYPDDTDATTEIALNIYNRLRGDDKADFDQAPHITETGEKSKDAAPVQKFDTNKFGSGGAFGCFVHAARFNHSCSPNCSMTARSRRELECYVIKDVAAGSELTFAYQEDFLYLTTDDRQQLMRQASVLTSDTCSCSLCIKPAAERHQSDLHRSLLRPLMHIWNGEDIAGGFNTDIDGSALENVYGLADYSEDKVTEPLRLFIDLAEQEGIVGGKYLRYAYCWTAEVLLQEAQRDGPPMFAEGKYELFERCTQRARVLKKNAAGANTPITQRGRSFRDMVEWFDSIIDEMEEASKSSGS